MLYFLWKTPRQQHGKRGVIVGHKCMDTHGTGTSRYMASTKMNASDIVSSRIKDIRRPGGELQIQKIMTGVTV